MNFECEGWRKITMVFPDMDFTNDLNETPELANYLRDAINKKAMDMEDPEESKELPKLDNDFSKNIIINNLPKCNQEKSARLSELLVKLFAKRNFIITKEDVIFRFDEEGMTTGQAFIKMKSDE
jgi:hypothetical protein